MKDHVESTAVNPEKLKHAKSVFIAKMDIHTFIISLSFVSVAVKNARKWRKSVLLWIVHVLVCYVHQCGVSSEFYTRTAKSGNVSVEQNTISANWIGQINICHIVFSLEFKMCSNVSILTQNAGDLPVHR